MVDVCRERGLEVERRRRARVPADARRTDRSAGCSPFRSSSTSSRTISCDSSNAAFDKLRPGAPIVLETINPACWVAFFESYIRDITHRWPLHPETLSFLVQASGFRTVDVQWRAPVPEADELPSVVLPPPAKGTELDATVVDLVGAINAHAEKLNTRLFTYLDYAVVARR